MPWMFSRTKEDMSGEEAGDDTSWGCGREGAGSCWDGMVESCGTGRKAGSCGVQASGDQRGLVVGDGFEQVGGMVRMVASGMNAGRKADGDADGKADGEADGKAEDEEVLGKRGE